jgi:hypothetical protein
MFPETVTVHEAAAPDAPLRVIVGAVAYPLPRFVKLESVIVLYDPAAPDVDRAAFVFTLAFVSLAVPTVFV